MKLNEYQEKAMSTCTASSHNYVYMAEGLESEVGEFKAKTSKAVRKDQIMINGNNIEITEQMSYTEFEDFKHALLLELGDVLWFVAGLADVLGCDLETLAQANLDKLSKRKAQGTIIGNGDGVTKEERL